MQFHTFYTSNFIPLLKAYFIFRKFFGFIRNIQKEKQS